MIAAIPSAVLVGVDGQSVSVEVHVSNGLPGFTVVGLPDAAVRESRDRVRAALLSSGLAWPLRRVTVNLAPSGVRKGGPGLDLPIAVGLLVASGQVDAGAVAGMAFAGELGLDGSLRGLRGMVVLAGALRGLTMVVPQTASVEATLLGSGDVRPCHTLREVVDRLRGATAWQVAPPGSTVGDEAVSRSGFEQADLADVRGQRFARRALEVAAAGGHHLLMVGPPGSGKTMLAHRLPGLLPDLSAGTALEVCRIRSVAGEPTASKGLTKRPPFRAPHHGASAVSLIGGGTSWMRPGEISLAHGGVLFLDEMGEFPAVVLDALRQPLEEGCIRVSRARGSVEYPARFLLVGAMNPCPCGEGFLPGSCRCSAAAKARYARRLSAPLLDRFDIAIRLQAPTVDDLFGATPSESTAVVSARVMDARTRAQARHTSCNATLPSPSLPVTVPMTTEATALVEASVRSGALSARGMHRVHRLARTIADLDGAGGPVEANHVREALMLRCRRQILLDPEER